MHAHLIKLVNGVVSCQCKYTLNSCIVKAVVQPAIAAAAVAERDKRQGQQQQ
jgi:hypothetical protein